MRYMFIVRSGHQGPPTPELMEAMGDLAAEEIRAGRMIDQGGLLPMPMGAEISLKGDKVSVLDGPFVESKEIIGGYAIFDFPAKEEAIASAVRFMELHRKHMPGWEGVCEMRPMAAQGVETEACANMPAA
ncbi:MULTISPECIES: YciI family protein [unclassified Phenylobacterium]|uniref:YciI family protein n=1 Tax=unclassified Phenylobacterium TaxID=2640670 RepID=UPI00083B893A|nr:MULTISPECIES: YciI family protein [unclassified Phenylobacterium]